MIGQIKGIIIAKQAPDLMIDVQGIGYEVLVSLGTFFDTPEIGGAVTLHTHFVVREDAQLLFGFITLEERTLFRQLIKVNGVGPKMALAILSGMSANEFAHAVHKNDIGTLVKLPGVGKKTAERLVIEMRDKIDDAQLNRSASGAIGKLVGIQQEAESALTALGYKPQDAAKMISRVSDEEITSAEQLIRRALKNMVSR
ncbi:MAG: ATP-dependent DNA helicase RuvA [SAR92 bacterium BACL26 MAG-121220-bin70]|jgi:holliday junction DNA helicase RuvA|uniref:Holliday junction branch migration complex subunit RuvA n=1 Tax=SAR92 bacterium BACL26 MAG-121220-bin70 TaxID=1655626 RepID=A0A0R2TYN8_9GAMM|nr:MAG: ATP-dependent DNA helicase RuvA [SAR92 bacterium BACL26 MAG-121220-bin70]